MTEENAEEKKTERRRRRGCLGWLWRVSVVCLLLLVGLLVWLNGPGIRWLGPKVAAHFIEKAGMTGELRLGGTVLGGLDVYDLEITGAEGAVERLVVDRLETDYRFMELVKGKVRGISGQGIHVDLRQIEKEKEETPPPDFAQIGNTLRTVREKVLPLSLDIQDVTFSMSKEGEQVVSLESTDLTHEAGADLIELDLGALTGPGGREVPPQELDIVWGERRLSLAKLDVLPIAGISDLEVLLPENGEVEASVDVRLDEAVLKIMVGAGIRDVRVDLTEGAVDFVKVADGVGVEVPVTGRLTSLAVDVKQVFPEWQTAVGTAELFVEDFSYDGWNVPEVSLGVTLDEGEFGAKLAGQALGSGVTITAGGGFERSEIVEGKFDLGRMDGTLNVEKLEEVLVALDGKFDMPVEFTEFPESDIGGTWAVNFGEDGFESAEGDVTMKAKEADATPVRLNARYEKDLVTVMNLEADGMEFSGNFDMAAKTYEAKQVLDGFDSSRIVPWLEGVGQVAPGSSVVSMDWEASGNFEENRNRGTVRDLDIVWKWNEPEEGEARPPISAEAEAIVYDWPGTVEVDGLVAETQGQVVKLDAKLAEQVLDLEKFIWLEGEEQLAEGTGKLPVPEDFSDIQDFMANNTEPLDLKIESKTLPLAKLKPWVPALEQIDGAATGKVDIAIAGSLAEPEVDTRVELRGISSPSQPQVPKTDVTINLNAEDGRAKISAEAIAPDYAPATLEAEMAFLPKKWAANPETVKAEEITGELDLPRIDLSRFQSLVPGAVELGGVAEGKMTVAGTIGEPEIDADLNLSGGKFRMDNDSIPALSGMDLDISTDLENVTIKGGVSDVEGGDMTLNGTLGLKSETGEGLGELDVSLRARGMPVLRNEFLIVRANADLDVKGTMEQARVSGEVGIIDSVFYKDMDLIPIGKPFLEPSAAALPSVDTPSNPGSAVPAPFSDWTADVVVKTIDPILIRGNLGKGQVDVALRIEGKLGDPQPNGTVRLSDAVARLPFSTLEIKEGFLRFTPKTGFDPVLEIRGTAEPRPYRVNVYAYGKASDPQLVMTSQPPLPENEIMTLLATGTTSDGLEDSQAASSRAMQLLIEELRRGRFLFGKQLRPVLGLLDNVDFSLSESDPYDSGTYNSATLKLSEKWYVSAGLGAEGDQRVLAIWRLRFK